jgi:cardiolipin synthase C
MRAVLSSLLLAAGVALAAGCVSLPPTQFEVSSAYTNTADTRLGEAVAPVVAANPGRSGIHALANAFDAFAARMLLASEAQRAIDAQYFIWQDDQVGMLLFQALWQAAERGVRVRLLLDDGGTSGIDATLAQLDAHPHIEVRLYNPFVHRGSRTLGYLGDFPRLNKRMHNKSFTVDNVASVVGGRNIANEYFGAGAAIGFADLDVLMLGPVVQQVSVQFDRYWNSASAYPAVAFVVPPAADAAARLQAHFERTRAEPAAVDYLQAVEQSPFLEQVQQRRLDLDWTTVQLLYDDPAKTLDRSARTDVLLFPALMHALGEPQRSFDIVSPYFVPGDDGTALLVQLARSGIKVRVLTNSLASSDESIVHAGYMKRRRELLRAGVVLYELKPSAIEHLSQVQGRFGAAKVSGLHAKTYAVDGERIFVGSFNFDQRSARLNTELGVVIDSRVGAGELARFFDDDVPLLAYEVRLAPQGDGLVWIDRRASGEQTHYDVDPHADCRLRFKLDLLADLPIDWLL